MMMSTLNVPEGANPALVAEIEKEIASAPVVVYSKGTREQPRCGFTLQLVQLFESLGIEFTTIDIFPNPEKKQLLNELFDWPTVPKVFIAGEFYGGADMMKAMASNGELMPLVTQAVAAAKA
jgi:monothiol glutaredoxin